jgi:hypothetical protein
MSRLASLFLIVALAGPPVFAAPVRILKSTTGWSLEVSGKPFFIKGVGCSATERKHGETYLRMALDMGANAVRTWGISPLWYFDQAEKDGLLVDAGVWFNPIRRGMPESYQDAGYRHRLTQETLAYVRKMKTHPALLSWNLGNEVFSHTDSEDERKAFGMFLKTLIDAVHKEDPNHPVIYSCTDNTTELRYLKAYVPNLDIVGINAYDDYRSNIRWLKANGYDKPVIATEFGCHGARNQPKDPNNIPCDPFDQSKASDYVTLWRDIEHLRDQTLGGFAFVLGHQRNQDSVTWFNLNYGRDRRQAFWSLYNLYTGKKPQNASPEISVMKIEPVDHLRAGGQVTVRTMASDPDGDRLHYRYFITDIATDPTIVESPRIYPTRVTRIVPGETKITVPDVPGTYRLYVIVSDGHQNIAVANRSIQVVPFGK